MVHPPSCSRFGMDGGSRSSGGMDMAQNLLRGGLEAVIVPWWNVPRYNAGYQVGDVRDLGESPRDHPRLVSDAELCTDRPEIPRIRIQLILHAMSRSGYSPSFIDHPHCSGVLYPPYPKFVGHTLRPRDHALSVVAKIGGAGEGFPSKERLQGSGFCEDKGISICPRDDVGEIRPESAYWSMVRAPCCDQQKPRG